MSTWTKYQLDWRSLRQARKAIPAVTCWLPLGYCRNLGELVQVKGGIISSFLSLIEGNPILPMKPRDGGENFCSRWLYLRIAACCVYLALFRCLPEPNGPMLSIFKQYCRIMACYGSGNNSFTHWALGLPLRLEVAFGNLHRFPFLFEGFVETRQKVCFWLEWQLRINFL